MQALAIAFRKARELNPRVLAALEAFGSPTQLTSVFTYDDHNDYTQPGAQPHVEQHTSSFS